MPHPSEHASPTRRLGAEEAEALAETLGALSSPGRLRMLAELTDGERSVDELTAAAGLSQSATSHHLRLLRSLRLVRFRRDGRRILYRLHDHHLGELLAAVRHHHEHVHPPEPARLPDVPERSGERA